MRWCIIHHNMSKLIKSAAVVIVNKHGHVLAQLRDDKEGIANPNTWAICGGGMETDQDSSLQAAAVRELLEETGYLANESDLHFFAQEYVPGRDGVTIQNNYFWALYDETQPIACYEGQEIRFLSPRECKELVVVPRHREWLLEVSGYLTRSSFERRRR